MRKARCGGLQLVVCTKYEAGIRCPRDFVICAKPKAGDATFIGGVSLSAQSHMREFRCLRKA